MNPRNRTLSRANVVKLNGPKPYRVADDRGRPLKTRHGKPLDRGGYANPAAAQNQAGAINQAIMRNAQAEALGRLTKRQKAASRREAKRRQREAAQKAAPKFTPTKEVAEALHALGQGAFPTSRVDINDSPEEARVKMENAT